MKKIIIIGASSSSNSINRKLANYAANSISVNKETFELDLRLYEMPIYSEDLHRSSGIPKKALEFKRKILNSDAIVIALA